MSDYNSHDEQFWVVGGSLPLHAPSYVKRKADNGLYEQLLAGDLCYVFNSRQMGKSSLRVQTTSRLQAAGVRCGVIDLSEIGSQNLTPEQWYASLLRILVGGFGLSLNLRKWWRDRSDFSPIQRLQLFIVEELLGTYDCPIVIFIDEIDGILNLPFSSDDFFAFIRACYNNRSDNPEYRRLSFALFGVTTPSDLISNPNLTPFNVGNKDGAIQLEGFTEAEAQPLLPGLAQVVTNPQVVLTQILQWTRGQPFLTQKLCNLVYKTARAQSPRRTTLSPQDVHNIVRKHVINNWEAQDIPEHLRTIRDRLLLHNEQHSGQILGLYKRLLLEEGLPADNVIATWPGQVSLQLSGLVTRRYGQLRVRNRIYQAVFNLDWVDEQLAKLRPYGRELNKWINAGKPDNAYLLRDSALERAQIWADNHNISEEDYQFLAASRDLESKIRERLLEAERILAVEAQLVAEKKSAKRQQFLLAAVSVGLLVACGLGLFAHRQYRQAVASQLRSTEREIEAIAAIADTRFSSKQTLDALVEAIRAHRRLEELEQLSTHLRQPSTVPNALRNQVLSTLQRTLFGVVEFNRLSEGNTPDPVFGVAYSPDGTQLATASKDGTIRLWQDNGKPLATLTGHVSPVRDVAFSPNGQQLASVSEDGILNFWNLGGNPDRKRRDTVLGDTVLPLNEVLYSADGNWVATVSDDGLLQLWRSSDGTQIRSIQAHSGAIYGLAISPDDRLIATGGEDNTVKLWDRNGNLEDTLTSTEDTDGHSGPVETVAFSPDGITLISGSSDNTLKQWRVRNGRLLNTFRSHTAAIHSVAFSPDGQTLVSTSADTTVKLWANDGTVLTTFSGHNAPVWDVAFSTQGQQLATASQDGTVRLWRPRNDLLNPLNGHGAAVNSVDFSPSGAKLVTASDDSTAKLWRQRDGALLQTFTGHTGRVSQAVFSPDGGQIATVGEDKTIKLWRVMDGRLLRTLPADTNSSSAHSELITSVTFSPDGRLIASASTDNSVRIWRLSDGRLVEDFRGYEKQINQIVFNPDGKTIAVLGNKSIPRLLTLDGIVEQEFSGHQAQVNDIAFGPDGAWIVTASEDGSAIVWNPDGTRQLPPLTYGSASQTSVNLSSEDSTLERQALEQFEQEVGGQQSQEAAVGVNAIAISPNSRYLATANQDNTIRIWQRSDGQLLDTLRGHEGSVIDVAFSPDGDYLASTGQDRKVLLWNLERALNEERLLAYACDWVQDYLSYGVQQQQDNRVLCSPGTEDN
ncbi:MAG: AAA-like domain-containing protein [Cyanobacteria bacterium P01_A01_bin.123]